jgi:hypothetical protein
VQGHRLDATNAKSDVQWVCENFAVVIRRYRRV